MKYGKIEVFHFSRLHGFFDPPLLSLSILESSVLWPKCIWKYLDFIFNKKLSFHQHINFHVNKAISIVKCMKILDNSVQCLNLQQKWLLYRSYVLPITFYGFQLWFYNKALLSYPLKELNKMQRRATIWILDAFQTLLSFSIKTITGLIPIHLHLWKLSSRSP